MDYVKQLINNDIAEIGRRKSMKEKCFSCEITIYDEEGPWYKGDGFLVAEREKIEGYIAFDYYEFIPVGEGTWRISFTNFSDKRSIRCWVDGLEIEFPGTFTFSIYGDDDEVWDVVIDVLERITNQIECSAIKKQLVLVRKMNEIS